MAKHRYATPTGEMVPADVRARAVGNAVFLEHAGGCGDIFAWGARDPEAAASIAGEITAVLDGLRGPPDDAEPITADWLNARLKPIPSRSTGWRLGRNLVVSHHPTSANRVYVYAEYRTDDGDARLLPVMAMDTRGRFRHLLAALSIPEGGGG